LWCHPEPPVRKPCACRREPFTNSTTPLFNQLPISTYKHIFFDLDRTLWDLEKNSTETIRELYDKHLLGEFGVKPFEHFFENYRSINDRMWKHYLRGDIDKETLRFSRFHKVFLEYGLDNVHLARQFGDDYISLAPYKKHLFPFTHEVLSYLQKKYEL